MKNNNPFLQHNIHWLSHSSINKWINDPAQFIAEKLFDCKDIGSASMHRGTATEFALSKKYEEGIFDINHAEQKFNELCNFNGIDFDNKKRQSESKTLKDYGNIVDKHFKYENLLACQEKIEVQFEDLPIPIIGYIDFIFDGVIVDLKTTARMPSKESESNKRQMAIYNLAYPSHQMELFYATPKQHIIFKPKNLIKYQKQIEKICFGMMKFLSISNDKEELASMFQPNFDSWLWSEGLKNQVKTKIQAWRDV